MLYKVAMDVIIPQYKTAIITHYIYWFLKSLLLLLFGLTNQGSPLIPPALRNLRLRVKEKPRSKPPPHPHPQAPLKSPGALEP